MIKWDKNIDAQIKRNVERTETAFEDASWQKMNVKLLKHTAEKKRKKKYTYYLLGALGFMALGFFAGQGSLTEKEQQEIVNTDSELSSVQNDSHLSQSLLLLNNEIPTLSNQRTKRNLSLISCKDLLIVKSYTTTKSRPQSFVVTDSREYAITSNKYFNYDNHLNVHSIEQSRFDSYTKDHVQEIMSKPDKLLSHKPNHAIKHTMHYTTAGKDMIQPNIQLSGGDKSINAYESGSAVDYFTQNATESKDMTQSNNQRSSRNKSINAYEPGNAMDYYAQNTNEGKDVIQSNIQRSDSDKPTSSDNSGLIINHSTAKDLFTTVIAPTDEGYYPNNSLLDPDLHDNSRTVMSKQTSISPLLTPIKEEKQVSTNLNLIETSCLPFDSMGSEQLAILAYHGIKEVKTDQYTHLTNVKVGEEQKEKIDKAAKKLLKKEQRIADKKSREQQKELANRYNDGLSLKPRYIGLRAGISNVTNQGFDKWSINENWNSSLFAEYALSLRWNLNIHLLYNRMDYQHNFYELNAITPTINSVKESSTIYLNEWGGDINLTYQISGKLRLGLGMHIGQVYSKTEQRQYFDSQSQNYETSKAINLTHVASTISINYPIIHNLSVSLQHYIDLNNLLPRDENHFSTPVSFNRTNLSLSYKFNCMKKPKNL